MTMSYDIYDDLKEQINIKVIRFVNFRDYLSNKIAEQNMQTRKRKICRRKEEIKHLSK